MQIFNRLHTYYDHLFKSKYKIKIVNLSKVINAKFHDDNALFSKLNDSPIFIHDGLVCEIEQQVAMAKSLRNAKVYVDVGSQFGSYLKFASYLMPVDGEIFSFEANPEYAINLSKIYSNSRFFIENIGVSDKSGSLEFFKDSFVKEIPHKVRHKPLNVKIGTLDSLMDKYNRSPDIVKIDIEGFEYQALVGCKDMIASGKTEFFVEIHHEYLRVQNINEQMILDLFPAEKYIRHLLSFANGKPFPEKESQRHRKTALSYYHFVPIVTACPSSYKLG